VPSSYYRNDRHGLSQYQWSPHDKKPRGKTVQGLCGLPRRPPGPILLWLPVLAFWACSFQPFVCLSVCKGGGVHSTSRCYLCDVDKNTLNKTCSFSCNLNPEISHNYTFCLNPCPYLHFLLIHYSIDAPLIMWLRWYSIQFILPFRISWP
jgi:hypothetical protein